MDLLLDVAYLRTGAGALLQFYPEGTDLEPRLVNGLLGVEMAEPDTHVLRFATTAIGRLLTEQEAINGLTEAAIARGVKTRELDWSTWEYQRTV
jgi:hypothetical protein